MLNSKPDTICKLEILAQNEADAGERGREQDSSETEESLELSVARTQIYSRFPLL